MHAAIDEGMTVLEDPRDYQDGGSEEIMGRPLAEGGKRENVFFMTKNCERDCGVPRATSRTVCAA